MDLSNKFLYLDPPSRARLTATSTDVIKTSSVTLLCSVDNPGKPDNLTYVWYRGSQLISDITTHNWTIKTVMYETKNKYTCYASNEGGDGDPASIFINVLGKSVYDCLNPNLIRQFRQLPRNSSSAFPNT